MKKLFLVEKHGKVLVLINKEDMYCPVCGKTMNFEDCDDKGIQLQCDACQIIRFYDFHKGRENLYPKPKLMVR